MEDLKFKMRQRIEQIKRTGKSIDIDSNEHKYKKEEGSTLEDVKHDKATEQEHFSFGRNNYESNLSSKNFENENFSEKKAKITLPDNHKMDYSYTRYDGYDSIGTIDDEQPMPLQNLPQPDTFQDLDDFEFQLSESPKFLDSSNIEGNNNHGDYSKISIHNFKASNIQEDDKNDEIQNFQKIQKIEKNEKFDEDKENYRNSQNTYQTSLKHETSARMLQKQVSKLNENAKISF